MLKLCRGIKVKVLFLVLVYVFNFNLFEFSAAILEKGLLINTDNGHLTVTRATRSYKVCLALWALVIFTPYLNCQVPLYCIHYSGYGASYGAPGVTGGQQAPTSAAGPTAAAGGGGYPDYNRMSASQAGQPGAAAAGAPHVDSSGAPDYSAYG